MVYINSCNCTGNGKGGNKGRKYGGETRLSEVKKKGNLWYKATEKLLYTYRSFPIRIMALRQQIEMVRQELEPNIVRSYEIHAGKTTSNLSPLEAAVINRIEGDTVQKLEQKINNLENLKKVVEVSIETMLNSEQRQLVNMKYYQHLTWQQICIELAINKNTFYDRKNDIVEILAWCFGYLPDDQVEEVLGLFMDKALWQQKSKVG